MERYQRVFELPDQLFTSGSPVIIEKGVLLKDLQTGNVLLQLKFRNIAAKTVIAVKITVRAYDISHSRLEGIEETQYLDLSAGCGAFFGADRVVQMPNSNTRNVEVDVLHVVFQDYNEWEAAKAAKWVPIYIEKRSLDSILDDTQLKQYQRETTLRAEFIPAETDDLWLCTCGHVNGNREKVCSTCFSTKSIVFSALDQNTLSTHAKAYEQNERELAAQATATKKLIIKLLIATVSVLLVTFLSITITNTVRFSKATKLAENGSYAKAAQIFEELDNYRDSEKKAALFADFAQIESLWQKGFPLLQSNKLSDLRTAENCFNNIQELCEIDEDRAEFVDNLDLDINNCLTYIKAKAEQYDDRNGSIIEALELYKTLPLDFQDVQERIEKIEPLIKFEGTWMNTIYYSGPKIETRVYFTKSDEPAFYFLETNGDASFGRFDNGDLYSYSIDEDYFVHKNDASTTVITSDGDILTVAHSESSWNRSASYDRQYY